MELRLLRTFVSVAETMNISAAARRLRVTQPALSRQIRALEGLVGHPLFVRHQRGLRLTATGMTLRDHGIKVVAAMDGGPYVAPSRATFQDRTYPLVRSIYFYLNRKPGTLVEPRFREFLRFILSRDGQQIVADGSGFLPLPAAHAAEQRAKLD